MDDDFLFEQKLSEYRTLCISTLGEENMDPEDVAALGSGNGYFIYETSDDPMAKGTIVLAKMASYESALRFIDLWRSKHYDQSP